MSYPVAREVSGPLEAIYPVAALACSIARDWNRSAGEHLGRTLDGDSEERRAATEALKAAQDAHGKAMALLFAVELCLARARAAQADADATRRAPRRLAGVA